MKSSITICNFAETLQVMVYPIIPRGICYNIVYKIRIDRACDEISLIIYKGCSNTRVIK